jgi:hypothetical protein
MLRTCLFKRLLMSCLFVGSVTWLQAAQEQPETPESNATFTVTVTQIGMPSWKTFYKIPVEVGITNNQNYDINLTSPYFQDLSLWDSEKIRCYATRFLAVVWASCVGVTLLSFPYAVIQDFMGEPRFTLHWMFPAIAPNAWFLKGLLEPWSQKKFLKAQETITITCYMSTADLQKISDGAASVIAQKAVDTTTPACASIFSQIAAQTIS